MCSADGLWRKKTYRGRTICTGDVGILSSRKKQSKEASSAGCRRKAGRNTRSVAAGIASQRILGASEMLPRHRLERWRLGRIRKTLSGKKWKPRNGPLTELRKPSSRWHRMKQGR